MPYVEPLTSLQLLCRAIVWVRYCADVVCAPIGQTNPEPDVDPEEPEEVTEAVCLESELQDGQ